MVAQSSPLLIEKRALLIGIRQVQGEPGSKFHGLPELIFTHRDVQGMRTRLIASDEYLSDNIVLMLDDIKHPKHLWPTRKNILRQLDILTSNASENGHFLFYFSGHAMEEEPECPNRARMRKDGRDSEIVCANGQAILDLVLHERLVKPLQKVKGSRLFAILDCCHSESLLDLQRRDGRPNLYSRAWNFGADRLFKDWVTVMVNLSKLNKKCAQNRSGAPRPLRRSSSVWINPPASIDREEGELRVICLSACRDRQSAHDDHDRGLTFTKCFLDATASKPNITWEELRDVLKELISEIQARYEELRLQQLSMESSTSVNTLVPWSQEPRYNNTHYTDLRQKVSF